MRRRLGRLLPIVLFALLVQIFAPVGACWAASIAASDPLHSAVICSAIDNADSANSNNTVHHKRDGSCSSCCVTHAGVPIDPPLAAFETPERHAYRVAWRAYEPDAIAARASSHAQARAPPAQS